MTEIVEPFDNNPLPDGLSWHVALIAFRRMEDGTISYQWRTSSPPIAGGAIETDGGKGSTSSRQGLEDELRRLVRKAMQP